MLNRTLLILLFSFSLAAAAQAPSPTPARTAAQLPVKRAPAPSTSQSPLAILHTTAGDMKCELFPAQAPKAVANFIALAKGTKSWKNPATQKQVSGKPLYDGVIFHRVIPNFMIQSGDPS